MAWASFIVHLRHLEKYVMRIELKFDSFSNNLPWIFFRFSSHPFRIILYSEDWLKVRYSISEVLRNLIQGPNCNGTVMY